ncbi:MAG: hypothetical protein H0X63_04660 [Flavobacteriales bacterium]|nr:hypothetical protein [Flavobacteriales bacterium]
MAADIFVFLLVLIIGFYFPKILKFQKRDLKNLKWLWLYHLFFGLYYHYGVMQEGGSDALKFWEGAKTATANQALLTLLELKGTRAMYAINYFPSSILDLSFFSGSMIYTFIGFMGICFFYRIIIELIPYNSKVLSINIFPFLFYLPNLHFWSVAVGKDTLLFFAVGLFSYSFLNLRKRTLLIIFSLLLAYLVRPHIMLFLALSFSMAYLFNNKVKPYMRFFLFSILIGIGILILPTVAEYAQMEELSFESYEEFAERGVENLSRSHTGSSVDVSSYSFPLKVFTFLYRPTFIDIVSLPSLLAALENFIVLLFSLALFKKRIVKTFKASPFIIKGLVFFLIIGTITFSMSLGNLGIMLRMKNMFLPGLLIFIIWSFSYQQQLKLEKQGRATIPKTK